MVDFDKLRAQKTQAIPTDPTAIFQRLPKPPHINDLWDGQSKALAAWHQRRTENDLVIKLNTGGGKTLVGLLMAQSLLNETHEPVLYLCPNNQLVEQTLEKANEVGLGAVAYSASPSQLAPDFLNGKVILLAPYHALFNGLSRFGVLGSGREPIKLGGIVCDDAHAALGVVRAAFTIAVTRKEHCDLYDEIVGRYRADFDSIGRVGTFDDIVEREDFGVLEVPYRGWLAKGKEIRELIAREYADEFKFQLPLVRDHFPFCHALISAREVAITPFQPLVHLFPSFYECKRRVYMSATIADDSSIVRTFSASPKSVANPIVPVSLAGVGERMILSPSLMELDQPQEVAKSIVETVSQQAGVVILVQSEFQAKQWQDAGTLVTGDDVAQAVKDLRSGTDKGPFIFASRYDGIDLAGDACRLLTLDGLPTATNQYELFRAEVLRGNSSINIGLAQRVEQAIGRGTRGAGDYCVVLLMGRDLTAWVARSASLSLMTPSTRTQVQMGYDISKSIKNVTELGKTVEQCLARDKKWVRYHAETLAERSEQPVVDAFSIEIAKVEREHIAKCLANDFDGAITVLRNTSAKAEVDPHLKGWLLQLAARAAYFTKQEKLCVELQQAAFTANHLLLPPPVKAKYEPIEEVGEQVANILDEVTRFALRKGALDEFERTVLMLVPSASSNQFEEALKRFGELLGFRAQRPDDQFREGPDVLWLCPEELGFVIECKHRKEQDNPLTKDEQAQFLTSMQWAVNNYPKRKFTGFVVHPNGLATKQAAATATKVLTLAKLGELVGIARQFYIELCSSTANAGALENVCADLLTKYSLRPRDIAKKFLVQFETAATGKKS